MHTSHNSWEDYKCLYLFLCIFNAEIVWRIEERLGKNAGVPTLWPADSCLSWPLSSGTSLRPLGIYFPLWCVCVCVCVCVFLRITSMILQPAVGVFGNGSWPCITMKWVNALPSRNVSAINGCLYCLLSSVHQYYVAYKYWCYVTLTRRTEWLHWQACNFFRLSCLPLECSHHHVNVNWLC